MVAMQTKTLRLEMFYHHYYMYSTLATAARAAVATCLAL